MSRGGACAELGVTVHDGITEDEASDLISVAKATATLKQLQVHAA